jgi:hypothetical protein
MASSHQPAQKPDTEAPDEPRGRWRMRAWFEEQSLPRQILAVVASLVTIVGGLLGVLKAAGVHLPWEDHRASVAREVRACQDSHGLDRQHVAVRHRGVTKVRSCDWPPPAGADRDGYSVIIGRTVGGPPTGTDGAR